MKNSAKFLRFLHCFALSATFCNSCIRTNEQQTIIELAASTTPMPNFTNYTGKYAQLALNCTPNFTICTSSIKFYAQHSANCGQKSGRFKIANLQKVVILFCGFTRCVKMCFHPPGNVLKTIKNDVKIFNTKTLKSVATPGKILPLAALFLLLYCNS